MTEFFADYEHRVNQPDSFYSGSHPFILWAIPLAAMIYHIATGNLSGSQLLLVFAFAAVASYVAPICIFAISRKLP